jgi:phage regulator Rha-like protein
MGLPAPVFAWEGQRGHQQGTHMLTFLSTHSLLTSSSQPLTMSSKEIADLTGKEHFHVMRDIDILLTALGLPEGGYLQNWIHPQNGQTYRHYALPQDLTITLVAGYNVTVRHRIVTRWIELEALAAALALPDFANPAEASARAVDSLPTSSHN